jgi:hypothetical protein
MPAVGLPLPLLSEVRVGVAGTSKTHRFGDSVEDLVRSAVANCSTRVLLPQLPEDFMRAGVTLPVSSLSPSARSRVKVVDRRFRLWNNIRAYCQPIHALVTPLSEEAGWLDRAANALYHLIIASRSSAQVYVNVDAVLRDIDRLLTRTHVTATSEASMRLASLRGVFAQLQPTGSLPGLRVQVGYELSLRTRLDEILEDAYLAEAGNLRQFLSVNANVASVRRDLRRLVHAISTSAKWARGIFSATEHVIGSSAPVAEKLLELIGQTNSPPDGVAILLSPRDRPHFGAVTCLSGADGDHFVYMSPARSLVPEGDALTYNVEYLDVNDPWNHDAR